MNAWRFLTLGLGCLFSVGIAATALAASHGRIEGRLTRSDGSGLSGVSVVLAATGVSVLTDADGHFTLAVEPGSHTVTLELEEYSEAVPGIEVPLLGVVRLDRTLGWELNGGETATVSAASGKTERLVEAPVAVTIVQAGEIGHDVAHGQLPKLLEFAPGVHAAPSGLYDFNFNTRGFNGVSNRRVKVLIDGRDPSEAFFGTLEWAALSLPLEDVAQAELVRGPGSALYGADASSGVVSLITRRPRDSQGGTLRLTGGELDTVSGELRWAGALWSNGFVKLSGAQRQSGDFTVSRNSQAEYSTPCTATVRSDCLPQEAVPLNPEDEDEATYSSGRLDHHFRNGSSFAFEIGNGEVSGPVLQSGLGRLQIRDANYAWMRSHYTSDHWSFLGTYKGRDSDRQTALATGANLALDNVTWKGELQGRWSLAGGRAQASAGLSHEDERIDSLDPRGPVHASLLNGANQQTLLFEPVRSEADAFFTQLDWRFGERLKLVVAGRYDDGSRYEPQWSPRGSLVYAVRPNHTLRLTYHQGFQAPSLAELFLQFDLEPAVNLAQLEAICAFDGLVCGFDVDYIIGEDPTQDATPETRVIAAGNPDLGVEETDTWEIGYVGQLGEGVRLSIDLYANQHDNFITDLLPQVGTALGRVNPAFGPYAPPDGLSDGQRALLDAGLAAALGSRLPFLSTNIDGTPILVLTSTTNFGAVDTEGLDFGLTWYPARGWSLALSYSWFDFDVAQSAPGLDGQLSPNTPENQASFGLDYSGSRWSAGLRSRWFDDYRWVSGPFAGDVDSSVVVDLAAGFPLGDRWNLGVHVSNLLDEEYFETFGGDLLGRRVLASLGFSW